MCLYLRPALAVLFTLNIHLFIPHTITRYLPLQGVARATSDFHSIVIRYRLMKRNEHQTLTSDIYHLHYTWIEGDSAKYYPK